MDDVIFKVIPFEKRHDIYYGNKNQNIFYLTCYKDIWCGVFFKGKIQRENVSWVRKDKSLYKLINSFNNYQTYSICKIINRFLYIRVWKSLWFERISEKIDENIHYIRRK